MWPYPERLLLGKRLLVLVIGFSIFTQSSGDPLIRIWQEDAGIRAFGANATAITSITNSSNADYVFKLKCGNDKSIVVATWTFFESDVDVWAPAFENISYLNISLDGVSANSSTNFKWYFSPLPEDCNNLTLITELNRNGAIQGNLTLRVEACQPKNVSTTNQVSWFKIESTQAAHYKDTANCSCFKTEEELYTLEGTKAIAIAKCEYDAQWVMCENLQCWSAPSNIAAGQMDFIAGTVSPFNCTYTQGFPNVSAEVFKINNLNVSKNYVLKSYDHGKNLSCQVISNFTQKKDEPYLSPPKIILVYYPPENSTLSSAKLVTDLNVSQVLIYYVNANPYRGSVKVSFKNGSDQDVTNMFNVFDKYKEEDDTLHIFRFSVTLTSDQNYGNYNVCASTRFPDGTNCAPLSIRNAAMSTPSLPDTATFSVTTGSKNLVDLGLPPPIIGAIVVGTVVIMLIVVGIVIHKKRKQSSSKDNVKEETVNVLYGSAQYQTSPAENPENVKQEKSNVLYESASGNAVGDLVEYATANPDGIASDDAVQYATSNPDAEDTSALASATSTAEPSCSGNTSVYAQINKKKGKVNDGYKIEMHDTSEATYTVVDKSKKRNKDNVPEVYAVVNKPRAKG